MGGITKKEFELQVEKGERQNGVGEAGLKKKKGGRNT